MNDEAAKATEQILLDMISQNVWIYHKRRLHSGCSKMTADTSDLINMWEELHDNRNLIITRGNKLKIALMIFSIA